MAEEIGKIYDSKYDQLVLAKEKNFKIRTTTKKTFLISLISDKFMFELQLRLKSISPLRKNM